ncbi:MAG: peptide chain release factor N(5)-glutamine methyltransferase, partial [Pseudomonadota bacterium]
RAADPLTAAQLKDLDAGSARLAAGEPLAYITGVRGFWDFTVTVTPAVLIPRPETETLVEAALERLSAGETALDLGTGSGAIAIALARSGSAAVTAVDASADALVVARNNAERLGAEIQFLESSWFDAISGAFHVIVANPPYVAAGDPHLPALAYEPTAALVAGRSGLDDLNHIIATAPEYLLPAGWLLVEHGYNQADPVADAFRAAGFQAIELLHDLGGQPRVTLGRLKRGRMEKDRLKRGRIEKDQLENAHGSQ